MGKEAPLIIGSVVASFGIAYVCNTLTSNYKIFGGSTTKTVSKEWQDETERKMNAWPRTAGPPVIMNPMTRHNYIVVKPSTD